MSTHVRTLVLRRTSFDTVEHRLIPTSGVARTRLPIEGKHVLAPCRTGRIGTLGVGRYLCGAALVVAGLLLAAVPEEAEAGLITISEVLYDATGADDGKTFVELFGPPGLALDGYQLMGVNGAGGGITHLLDLAGLTFPADGFLVLADRAKGGGTLVAESDFLFPNINLQNGPDSIRLIEGSVVVDALGYGSFGPLDVFAGEGFAAQGVLPGASLARRFADLDTDMNLSDFEVLSVPTPGMGAVTIAPTPVPEPGTLLLVGTGLVLVYLCRRSRS